MLIRILYNTLTFGISLILFPLFLCSRRGRARILERFGRWDLALEGAIWLHGASVGEINGLIPVLIKLRECYPGVPLLVTATSVTGLEHVARFADHTRLLPFDNPIWIRLAMRRIKPRLFVFTETEIWPALLEELFARRTPVIMINARISDFSIGRYRRFRFLLAPLLARLSVIFASDAVSRDRLIELGASEQSVRIAGNAKYDIQPSVKTDEEREALRRELFGNSRPILTLGSLRPGEERDWFPAIVSARAKGLDCNLVVAPRHQEKFSYFADAMTGSGIEFVRWSNLQSGSASAGAESVFLDTMGLLERIYSISNISFVGGTLENWGGHNPLEPASYGNCIVMGPFVQNAREICEDLFRKGGAISISNRADIDRVLECLISGDPQVIENGKRAREVWAANAGAAARIVAGIEAVLSASGAAGNGQPFPSNREEIR
jgi:3-deoxy-D-manno-octulosonic-acid transferase